MKEVVLKVPDNKYGFFMELIRNLGFVQIGKSTEGDSKEDIMDNLKRGFEDMKSYNEGKLKTTPARDFLNEL